MRVLPILLIVCACLTPAYALNVAGVNIPPKTQVAGQELVLNGAGVRVKFIVKVYVAALYLPQKLNNAQAILQHKGPKRVVLTLKRDVNADDLWENFNEALGRNHSEAERAKIKPALEQIGQLFKAMGGIKEGDVIQLDFNEANTQIWIRGEPRITLAGPNIGRALLRIWLGDHPATEELKSDLLGTKSP